MNMTFFGYVCIALLMSFGAIVIIYLVRLLRAKERTAKALEDIASRMGPTRRPD